MEGCSTVLGKLHQPRKLLDCDLRRHYGFQRRRVAKMFLCQDFDSHVVKLIVHLFSQVIPQDTRSTANMQRDLLNVIFDVRQLALECSDRGNGRFLRWSVCMTTSLRTVTRASHDTLIGVFCSALHGPELISACNQHSPGEQHNRHSAVD